MKPDTTRDSKTGGDHCCCRTRRMSEIPLMIVRLLVALAPANGHSGCGDRSVCSEAPLPTASGASGIRVANNSNGVVAPAPLVCIEEQDGFGRATELNSPCVSP
jgi:hypothetical protein